jgi:hypothetical protein
MGRPGAFSTTFVIPRTARNDKEAWKLPEICYRCPCTSGSFFNLSIFGAITKLQ